MKFSFIRQLVINSLLLTCFFFPRELIAISFDVTIDTTPIMGMSGFLAFDFVDGDGLNSNISTIDNFTTDATLGTASTSGNVIGTLQSKLIIGDASFFNEFLQKITFGTFIMFRLDITTNEPFVPFPDEFSFFLLNGTQIPFSTSDLSGADALFLVDIVGPNIRPTVFISSSATTTVSHKLDHFLCYQAKETKGSLCSSAALANIGGACKTEEDCGGNSALPTAYCVKNKFPAGRQVDLRDQFEAGRFDIKGPESLCNPVNKDGEGIFDPLTHLKGYQIALAKTDPKQPKHVAQWARIDDPLATLFVQTSGPDRLLTPTAKSLEQPLVPPEPNAHSVNHYKCYKVKVVKKLCEANPGVSCKVDEDCKNAGLTGICNLGFPKKVTVGVTDQFKQMEVRLAVTKPIRLCVPVEKTLLPMGTPEPIKPPAEHLMCYAVKPDKGQPKHEPMAGIYLNNQFGPERLDTVKEEELCIPAAKTPLSGPLAGTQEEGD